MRKRGRVGGVRMLRKTVLESLDSPVISGMTPASPERRSFCPFPDKQEPSWIGRPSTDARRLSPEGNHYGSLRTRGRNST